jgi:hypothetical protein
MTKNNENNGLLSAIIFFYFLVLERTFRQGKTKRGCARGAAEATLPFRLLVVVLSLVSNELVGCHLSSPIQPQPFLVHKEECQPK